MQGEKREKFWWKKYMKKDKNIIRPLDGYEYFLTVSYLTAIDIFPKFNIDDFYICAKNNLPQIDIFNYQIKFIEEYPFWYYKKLDLIKNLNFIEIKNLGETDYKKYLQTEKISDGIDDNYDPEDKSIKLSYRFEICQINEEQTMLTMRALHATSDGRTLFNIFEYVSKVIDFIIKNKDNKDAIQTKIFLEKKEVKICPFGQYDNYVNLDKKIFENPPEKWLEIPFRKILPDFKIEKNSDKVYYVNQHYIFNYKKIQDFCKKNKTSVQAMLITMISRATRKYYNLPEETELYNYTPCDSRQSKFASEYLKNREFFCGAGALFPKCVGQGDLIKDLQYNYTSIRECIPKLENIIQIMRSSMTINKETLEFTPETKMPSFSTQACTCSSHIGKVKGNLPAFGITLSINKDISKNDYIISFHCVHTDNDLVIMVLRPNLINEDYYNVVINEMNIIFNL